MRPQDGVLGVVRYLWSARVRSRYGAQALLGGRLSRSLSPVASLRGFAVLEILIGLCGIASPHVLYDVLYMRHGALYGDLWMACLLHFAVLIIPTSLMGMTLPLMTRALVHRTSTAARSVGTLYGMNTLGAAFGAFLSPWAERANRPYSP